MTITHNRRKSDQLRNQAAEAHRLGTAKGLGECWRLLDEADALDKATTANNRRKQPEEKSDRFYLGASQNMHSLKGDPETRTVWLDGKQLDPRPSQKHHNHSPDGFNWGYEGSGPAQLALAIILEITGKPDGYQEFKRAVIAALPMGQPFDTLFFL